MADKSPTYAKISTSSNSLPSRFRAIIYDICPKDVTIGKNCANVCHSCNKFLSARDVHFCTNGHLYVSKVHLQPAKGQLYNSKAYL